MLDGEWRVAFLAGEVPDLAYGSAPVPVDERAPGLYGSGYINGSVIGIPARSGLQDESWKLVKYLATDDQALAKLSNGLRNVPSTKSALRSPDLIPDAHFAVFLDIFGHPKSSAAPVTAAGTEYEGVLTAFAMNGRPARSRTSRPGCGTWTARSTRCCGAPTPASGAWTDPPPDLPGAGRGPRRRPQGQIRPERRPRPRLSPASPSGSPLRSADSLRLRWLPRRASGARRGPSSGSGSRLPRSPRRA